jgi:hypothetical protein
MIDIEAEKTTVQAFVDKGNFHAAVNIAISAMNECRRNNDQAGIDTFLDNIKDIADTMREQFGSQ